MFQWKVKVHPKTECQVSVLVCCHVRWKGKTHKEYAYTYVKYTLKKETHALTVNGTMNTAKSNVNKWYFFIFKIKAAMIFQMIDWTSKMHALKLLLT